MELGLRIVPLIEGNDASKHHAGPNTAQTLRFIRFIRASV